MNTYLPNYITPIFHIVKNHMIMNTNTYLLDGNNDYKILILYILKKLNRDVKQKIYNILIIEEIEELNKIMELMNQNWTELSPTSIMDLYELDLVDSD